MIQDFKYIFLLFKNGSYSVQWLISSGNFILSPVELDFFIISEVIVVSLLKQSLLFPPDSLNK